MTYEKAISFNKRNFSHFYKQGCFEGLKIPSPAKYKKITIPYNKKRIWGINFKKSGLGLMKNLIVKKFGGTSVGSIEKISLIAKRLLGDWRSGEHPIVVVSAMSGQTSSLINMAYKVHPFPQEKGTAYDMLLSSGEQISVALLSLALEKQGLKNTPLLAYQVGIQTDSFFSKASIQSIQTTKLERILAQGHIPVVAGFQGVTKNKQITTLGRGGSDLTAVALSCALNLKTCEIFTDVEGVFTADPKLVPQARKQKELSFSEMMEMSYVGSKVMQIRSVELAGKYNINIHVRHAFKKGAGTWITRTKEADMKDSYKFKSKTAKTNRITRTKEASMEGSVVSAIAHDLNTIVIKLNHLPKGIPFLSDLFRELGNKSVFVDIISHSNIAGSARLSFSIPKTDLKACKGVLKKFVQEKDISIIDRVAKISVVGVGMASHSGVAGRFFLTLKKTKAKLYLITTSEIKISAVIDQKDLKKTAIALHKEFKLSS